MIKAMDMVMMLNSYFVVDEINVTASKQEVNFEVILNEATTDWVELDDQVFDFTCEGAVLVEKTEIHENNVDGRIWEVLGEDGNTLTIMLEN